MISICIFVLIVYIHLKFGFEILVCVLHESGMEENDVRHQNQ